MPGRLQIVGDDPLTILDGAHNPAGMAALAAALRRLVGDRPLVAVVSVLDDKDAAGMLRALLGKCAARGLLRLAQPPRPAAGDARVAAEQLGGPTPVRGRRTTRARRSSGRASWPARTAPSLATGSIYLVADLVGDPARRRASAL